MVGGGDVFYTWNFGSTGPRWSKIADFEPIIACSASAVTPSEISLINANRKSTTRFLMSLRWSSYVAPKSPKGGLKNARRPISVKNRTSLEEICYKVSLCKNCQRQSCKAFIAGPDLGEGPWGLGPQGGAPGLPPKGGLPPNPSIFISRSL